MKAVSLLFGWLVGLDEEFLFICEVKRDGIVASVWWNELIYELSLAFASFYSLEAVPLAVYDTFVLRVFYPNLNRALLT